MQEYHNFNYIRSDMLFCCGTCRIGALYVEVAIVAM